MTKYEDLVQRIEDEYPQTKIRYLGDYWLWRVLPKRLKRISMAWPNNILLSTKEVSILAHEYSHIDWQNSVGVFQFLWAYFSPQAYAILPLMIATISFLLGINLVGIIGLGVVALLLLPWQSKNRFFFEKEGYLMNLAVAYWTTGKITENDKKNVVDSLCSSTYYKMIWKREIVEKTIDKLAERIINDPESFAENTAFRDTYEIFHP